MRTPTSVLSPRTGHACPSCGGIDATLVPGQRSQAVDLAPYYQCNRCGGAFRVPVSRGQVAHRLLLGISWLVLAALLFIGAQPLSILAILGLVAGCAGISNLWEAVDLGIARRKHPAAVELFVYDNRSKLERPPSAPPDTLAAWMRDCAAKDQPLRRQLSCVLGNVCYALGQSLAFIAILIVCTLFGILPHGPFEIEQWIGLAVGAVFATGLSLWMLRIGKGLADASLPAWKALSMARSAPILLLRSFDDDHHRLWTNPGNFWELSRYSATLEDALRDCFPADSPLITLGKPGERIAPSGAHRAWLSHDVWTDWIAEFLVWAERVVLLLGRPQSHPSLAWELNEVFAKCQPQKILVVVPPGLSEDEVRARWTQCREVLRDRIPEYRRDVIAFGFTADWNAIVVTMDRYRQQARPESLRATISALANGVHPSSTRGQKFATEIVDGSGRVVSRF